MYVHINDRNDKHCQQQIQTQQLLYKYPILASTQTEWTPSLTSSYSWWRLPIDTLCVPYRPNILSSQQLDTSLT